MSLSRRPSSTFDASSGLSWSEHTVSAPDARRRLTFRTAVPTSRRKNNVGCPTLEELAIRSLLANVDAVEVGMLDGLDWEQHGSKLWNRIEAANLTTPTIWSAFCCAFPPRFNYYRATEVTLTRASFDDYTSFLSAPLLAPLKDFCWLTALTVSNLPLQRSHVLAISNIRSLVALDIHSRYTSEDLVNDRIVRAWSERASNDGAFSRLRVLILRQQPHVTSRCLQFLSAFPALILLGIAACGLSAGDEQLALGHGWTTEDSHNILADVQRDMDMSQTWDGALYGCVRRSKCLAEALLAAKQAPKRPVHPAEPTATQPATASAGPDPPILSYRLGPGGHTIFSNLDSFAPLIFFRHVTKTTFAAPPELPPTSHTSHYIWPHEPGPKKRRLKLNHRSAELVDTMRDIVEGNAADRAGSREQATDTNSPQTPPKYGMKEAELPGIAYIVTDYLRAQNLARSPLLLPMNSRRLTGPAYIAVTREVTVTVAAGEAKKGQA